MPETWRQCAEDLLISSCLLYNSYSSVDLTSLPVGAHVPDQGKIFGIIKMLRAMALECLFKALWLKKGGKLAKDGKYVKIPGTNDHNLLSLADRVSEKCGLSINSDDRELLKRLSLSISRGRYPINKIWELTKTPPAGKVPAEWWRFPTDEQMFLSLLSRLTERLDSYSNGIK